MAYYFSDIKTHTFLHAFMYLVVNIAKQMKHACGYHARLRLKSGDLSCQCKVMVLAIVASCYQNNNVYNVNCDYRSMIVVF